MPLNKSDPKVIERLDVIAQRSSFQAALNAVEASAKAEGKAETPKLQFRLCFPQLISLHKQVSQRSSLARTKLIEIRSRSYRPSPSIEYWLLTQWHGIYGIDSTPPCYI